MDVAGFALSVVPVGIAAVSKVIRYIDDVRSVDGKIEQDRNKIELLEEQLPLIRKIIEEPIRDIPGYNEHIRPYIEKVIASSENILMLWREVLPSTIDTRTVLGRLKRHVTSKAKQLATFKQEIMINQQLLLTCLTMHYAPYFHTNMCQRGFEHCST